MVVSSRETEVGNELRKYTNPEKAASFPRFFKTGKGEYGEGDKFIGVTVPNQRLVAKRFKDLPILEIQKLLGSEIHEERLTALFILVNRFNKAAQKEQEKIYNFYLSNTGYVNNWDLVDSSASYIIGKYLYENPNCVASLLGKEILSYLAKSQSLWERRIAIIATHYFIRKGKFDLTLTITKLLLNDKQDLIHKAVGWMLREVSNNDQKLVEKFIDKNYKDISRTDLRYAVEKFPGNARKEILHRNNYIM